MEKQFKATQKYLLMSPRKIRLVVGVIKKMKPAEAVEKLPFVQKRASAELAKVIKSAITSAKNAGVSETDLIFKEIQIGEGPRLKRGKAASRGMWHPFKRRMAHIRVILASTKVQEVKKEEKPAEAKAKVEKSDKQSLASQGPGEKVEKKEVKK
jgi:large subunit ribosomal protein L22